MLIIYEKLVPLEGDVLTRRIYSPRAYRSVRDAQVVPIVHVEAPQLTAWFPIAWRAQGSQFELIVLRGLSAGDDYQPPRGRGLLPLLLSAYPFAFDPPAEPTPGGAKAFDDVFADQPTDIGATVTTVDRKPGLATQRRLAALDTFAEELPATRAIAASLADSNLLEPWNLSFDVEGRKLEVTGLMIARQAAFNDGRYSPILAKHGVAAAQLLGLHRISLYRAGLLLTMAKEAQKQNREEPDCIAGEFAV